MPARVAADRVFSPNLYKACQLLDLEVRQDLYDREDLHYTAGHSRDKECTDECNQWLEARYFLHDNDDPSVGIRGDQFSPPFADIRDLEAWAEARMEYITFMGEYLSHTDHNQAIDYKAWWDAHDCTINGKTVACAHVNGDDPMGDYHGRNE